MKKHFALAFASALILSSTIMNAAVVELVGSLQPMPGTSHIPLGDGLAVVSHISSDGMTMFLSTWGEPYDGSLHIATRDPLSGNWSVPTSLGFIGGGASLSPDGQTMYYGVHTSSPYVTRLYRTTNDGSGWVAGSEIPNISSQPGASDFSHWPLFNGTQLFWTDSYDGMWVADYDEATDSFSTPGLISTLDFAGSQERLMWVSKDGRSLVFSSDKPGGFGGFDLYSATWDAEEGEWGQVANLGNEINGPGSFHWFGVIAEPQGTTPGLLWVQQDGQLFQAAFLPEPASLCLLALGGFAFLRRRP